MWTGDHALWYHTYLALQGCDLKNIVALAYGTFLRPMAFPKLLSVHDDDEPTVEVQTGPDGITCEEVDKKGEEENGESDRNIDESVSESCL